MNTAILLSGGVGSRLQSDIPKQYLKVAGKRMLTYSLLTLINSPLIDEIVIVAEEEWRNPILADVREQGAGTKKIAGFATPGASRQESIWNGLQKISEQQGNDLDFLKKAEDGKDVGKEDAKENAREQESAGAVDYVMIHDAARPFLAEKMIEDCFTAVVNHDGVMPVLPMKDTVYYSEDGSSVSKLLERKSLFAGQAPEVFDFAKYLKANRDLLPDQIHLMNGSTEAAILAGMDVVMIPGDEMNFKITTRADLKRCMEIMGTKEGGLH